MISHGVWHEIACSCVRLVRLYLWWHIQIVRLYCVRKVMVSNGVLMDSRTKGISQLCKWPIRHDEYRWGFNNEVKTYYICINKTACSCVRLVRLSFWWHRKIVIVSFRSLVMVFWWVLGEFLNFSECVKYPIRLMNSIGLDNDVKHLRY